MWTCGQLGGGAATASVRRRLSALSSFYRYCAAAGVLADGVARPAVDPDYTATAALDRGQARALVAATDADTGAQALRTRAMVRLLPHNALRVDEACSAGLADLSEDRGHRVLTGLGKGNRKAKIPLIRVPAGRWTPTSLIAPPAPGWPGGSVCSARCWPRRGSAEPLAGRARPSAAIGFGGSALELPKHPKIEGSRWLLMLPTGRWIGMFCPLTGPPYWPRQGSLTCHCAGHGGSTRLTGRAR
jgi:hypothetical protein